MASDKDMRKKIEFPTSEEVAEAMAEYTVNLSKKFCMERHYFTLVLSGGDLISWLSKLLDPKYDNEIEWSKWHIFWVDERVVPLNHSDSNYKQTMDGFLSDPKVKIPIENIHTLNDRYAVAGNAKGVAIFYAESLKRLVNEGIIRKYKSTEFPQFDLELLGMGHDGHMASLFPERPQIHDTVNWVTYITDSPKNPPKRITFTLPVINYASYNLMAVCGEEQAHAVAEIFIDNLYYPAARLTADTEAIWYLDEAAASKLPKGV